MKKTFFLFFMLFASSYCFSQDLRDIGQKLQAFSDNRVPIEQIVPVLETYRDNPANFTANFSPNMTIIDATIDQKIYKYDGIEQKLRLYFSTSAVAVRANNEAELIEFIDNL